MNTIKITDEQWDRYYERYGRLIKTICTKISGDIILADNEDLHNDLCITAINSINGFYKKTNQSFDEMFENPLFARYTKTCLWNYKNNIGKKITNYYEINKNVLRFPSGNDSRNYQEIVCVVSDPSSYNDASSTVINNFLSSTSFTNDEKKIIDYILKDPDTITIDGRINYSSVYRKLGLSPPLAERTVVSLKNKLKRIYDVTR